MRYVSLNRFLVSAFLAGLTLSFSGCQDKPDAAGPEVGSIEAYLEANPEERIDDENDAQSEEAEFEAGS